MNPRRIVVGVLLLAVLPLPAQNAVAQKLDVDKAVRTVADMKANTPPDEVYAAWNNFCLALFGAEKTPEVYDLYGKDLALVEGGDWTHASANSACVAWETNLPATGCVEFGETDAYGQKTSASERPFYIHVHYLTGLKTGATYHYRTVSVDERGNKVVSKDATFTASAPDGAVMFPAEGQEGPPYVLDKANTTYVLTRDVTADFMGIDVKAEGVTIDLNGHTLVYHNRNVSEDLFTNEWTSHEKFGAPGIRDFGFSKLAVMNGIIREGAGTNAGNKESTGYIPVYARDCADVRILGVTVDYHTPQNTGMRLRTVAGPVDVGWCVFLDRGCKITNRHAAAVRALSLLGQKSGDGYRVHHNLVKRTRQMGLLGPKKLDHNEVYVDSWSVNSFSLACWKDEGGAAFNRVFGTGVNVQGFGWGEKNCLYANNLIHLEGIGTGNNRGKEGWGDQDSLNGLRVTNYGEGGQKRDNLRYVNNAVIIRCRGGSQARGTEFFSDETITDLVCEKSTLRVESADDKTDRVGCVVTHGHPKKADTSLPVWYKDLTLTSNICNIRFGDYYGKGSNHHFVRCRLLRTGNDPRYHTFIVDGQYWSRRHVLLDCEFGPGTAIDDVLWLNTGNKSFYSIAWTLTVKTAPGARVTIKDSGGNVAFEGVADKDGNASAELIQCTIRPPQKLKCPSTEKVVETKTPYAVTVEKDGQTKEQTVEMTKTQELKVGL